MPKPKIAPQEITLKTKIILFGFLSLVLSLFAYGIYFDFSFIGKMKRLEDPVFYYGFDNSFVTLMFISIIVFNLYASMVLKLSERKFMVFNIILSLPFIFGYGFYANDISKKALSYFNKENNYKVCDTKKRFGKGVFTKQYKLCLIKD